VLGIVPRLFSSASMPPLRASLGPFGIMPHVAVNTGQTPGQGGGFAAFATLRPQLAARLGDISPSPRDVGILPPPRGGHPWPRRRHTAGPSMARPRLRRSMRPPGERNDRRHRAGGAGGRGPSPRTPLPSSLFRLLPGLTVFKKCPITHGDFTSLQGAAKGPGGSLDA
jgi:hypothetical protein